MILARLFFLVTAFCLMDSVFVFAQRTSQKATMLILGSANFKTLQHRIDVAYRLYSSDIVFKRIIVSGGCGAHNSSICEASRMDSLLTLKGIPSAKIFKEEKSQTTKQNYCYSKKLTHDGKPLILKDDPLYVVSDHWHAIPVASCFRQVVGVKNTNFHIEGTIAPKAPADYTHIFKNCNKNNYCRNILWAFVDASFFDRSQQKIYYFADNIYYRKTPGQDFDDGYPKRISQFPGWPQAWDEHIDAAYYKNSKVYLFRGTKLLSISLGNTEKSPHRRKIHHYFKKWPKNWGEDHIDAAYYNETKEKLYLFRGSDYLQYNERIKDKGMPARMRDSYVDSWPFQWATGDVDAAYYNPLSSRTYLFRGQEYLQFSQDKKKDSLIPKTISMPWPTSIWGNRP